MTDKTFQEPVVPLPSVITSFRDDLTVPINWEVVPVAGEFGAKVDFTSGVMAIPLSGDAHSQRQQLRQLVQARVSPMDDSIYGKIVKEYASYGITEDILRVAESARISVITEKFASVKDLEYEVDGSEKTTGRRLATANTTEAWDKAVEYTIKTHGTKAFDSFAAGIRSVNPAWSKQLRALNKRIESNLNGSAAALGDTTVSQLDADTVVPNGFRHSINVASCIKDYLSDGYRAPSDVQDMSRKEEDKRASEYGESDEFDYTKGTMGRDRMELDASEMPDDFEFPHDDDGFAKLIIDDTLPLTVEVAGYMRRKRRAMTSGRRIVHPSRMLTDPQRRVFAQKVKVKGGIVVVDVSGSMSLSMPDIEAIVEAAPAAVIIAYSQPLHSDDDTAPNAWILANRGWRAKDMSRVRCQGNGVDGPALTWAIRHRKPGEDIVWVSDGRVTSKNDGYNHGLAIECAKLVKKHKIIMIPSVVEAVAMFKKGKLVNKPAGPIRDALLGRY